MVDTRVKNAAALLLLIGAAVALAWVIRGRTRPEPEGRPDEIGRLIAKSRSGEVRAQCQALAALGGSRSRRVLPILVEKLKHPQANVREAAARALGHHADPKAVKPLSDALADRTTRVRFAAVRALGRLGAPEALPVLQRELDAGRPLAADAALVIGMLKTRKAEAVLLAALASSRMNVRLGAIEGLALCGTQDSVAHLEKLLADPLAGIDAEFLARAKAVGEPIEPFRVAEPCARALAAIRARVEEEGP